MPVNTNILLIRHAEKPDDDTDKTLAVPGQERTQAYIIYFQNYALNSQVLKLNYIFATANSHASHRPLLTITPLANALNITPNSSYKDAEYDQLATEIKTNTIYNSANLLICWHHGELPKLAKALGMPEGVVPDPWPSDVFGWTVQMSFDANGNLSSGTLINQQLMYNDYGQVPPAPPSPIVPSVGSGTSAISN